MAHRLNLAVAAAMGLAAAPMAAMANGLRFLDSTPIAVKDEGFDEPSGLARAGDGSGFWTVSDSAARVFALDPGGALLRARIRETGVDDLEGVAEDAARGRLLAVAETTAEILALDLAGGTVARHPLAALEGFDAVADAFRDAEDGLEGIAVHPETGAVFVVKERGPRLLLELTPDLRRIRGALELTKGIGFRDDDTKDGRLDVSGLEVDVRRGGLWIVSDTGARAYLLDLSTLEARSWPLRDGAGRKAGRIENAEGVALSADGTVLAVVTDDGGESRFYRYAIEID